MDVFVIPFLLFVKAIIGLAMIVVIADVLLGWLIAANILNTNNQFVYSVLSTISLISEKLLRPVRKAVPTVVGSIDLSPLLLILILSLLENIINRLIMKF